MSLGIQKRSAIIIAKPMVPFSIVETPILKGITYGAFCISSAARILAYYLQLHF